MKIKIFLVDSFTDEAFKGNPAGVCLLDEKIPEKLMQNIAMEVNAAETAFVMKDSSGENKFFIRYYSPQVEIAFCGHATVASAKVLFEKNNYESVEFTTHHGLNLSASKHEDKLRMVFPLFKTTTFISDKISDSLGIKTYEDSRYCKDNQDLVVRVRDKETLQSISPDFNKLKAASAEFRGVCVTAPSKDEGYDFYSRFFAPAVGINEDPVTGSAHSVLAKYWSDILGKKELSAYQLSVRGGYLKLRILEDNSLEVISNAKITIEGELNC
ncbi:MAG: PhzF family phenazine biosynthesis protein [Ignavibacteria bacterium]|nr:PhzF family phenazine biosynthesis protein [Ignavibacteria bacterium]